jgi:hypothetical protein
MICYLCDTKLETGSLCDTHALELKEDLDLGKTVPQEEVGWGHHCQICGEHIGKTLVDYKGYGYFCSDDINSEYSRYRKS